MAAVQELLVVALDVGGTSMKGWVCGRDTQPGRRLERPTPAADGPDAVIAAIRAIVRELHAGDPGVAAVGVVVPGVVDPSEGIARYATNLGWRDVPLRDLLRADVGCPVALDHDVRAGGLAESVLGATGDGTPDDMLFVPIGTGIAGAYVSGGAVQAGAFGGAGEVGHVIVRPDGEPCACGQTGCVETYASAAAIARRYGERTGVTRTAEQIVGLLGTDPDADAVWAEAIDALALGLAACTMLLDPGRIVVGGGLAAAGAALFGPLAAALRARLTWRAAPPLVPAVLGSAAGRHGAALLAWRAADAAPAVTS